MVIRFESDDLAAAVEESKAGVERAGRISVLRSHRLDMRGQISTPQKARSGQLKRTQKQREAARTKLERMRALFRQKHMAAPF